MDEKMKKNEELQSRREFFKKAAKGALPILGTLLLINAPMIAATKDAPSMACDNSCWYTCMDGCKGGCTGTCSSCNGRCASNCQTTCLGGCVGSCLGTCEKTCSGTCKGGEYMNF